MADSTTSVYALVKPEVNVSTTWPTSLNGDMDTLDDIIARPKLAFNAPTVAATTTLDLSLARRFRFTVTTGTTIAFSNVPSSSFWTEVVVEITNGNAFALAWPASVVWLSGITPILKSSGVDFVYLATRDGGTTWYASLLGRAQSLVGQVTTDAGTGANTAETTLHTVTVPANCMGPNGALRVTVIWSTTGAANTKQIAVYFGNSGALYLAQVTAGNNVTTVPATITIVNRNATNSQVASGVSATTATAAFFNGNTAAQDTTIARDITVKGTTPNSADEVTAHATTVELLRA